MADTIVQSEKLTPAKLKNEFSAIPVMIPGSAIGRQQERDRLAAEEPEAVDRERGHRAEHERDRGRDERRP